MSERDDRWFPFYPGRFLGNELVSAMNLQETGGYLRLLLSEWNNGSISADLNVLARLLKVTSAEMEMLWVGMSPCFTEKPDEPGRLICEFMETVREEVRQRLDNAHAAAVKRWEVRRSKQGRPEPEQVADKSYQDLSRLDAITRHDTTIYKNADVTDSPMFIAEEKIKRTQRALSAHRRNGTTPDERITRQILEQFDDEADFDLWIADLWVTLQPQTITGRYAIYLANARTWAANTGQRRAAEIASRQESTMHPETRRRIKETRTESFDPSTITGEKTA